MIRVRAFAIVMATGLFTGASASAPPSPADEKVILANIAALGDPDPNKRYSATHQLGSANFYDRTLRGHCEEAAKALAPMEPAIDETYIVKVLSDCGAASIQPAREVLKSQNPTVRRRGVIVLAGQGAQAAAAEPELLALFEKSEGHDRMTLAAALAKINPRNSAPVAALIEGLDSKEEYQRAWYIEPLAEMGPTAKAAVPKLRQLMDSGDARISRLAGDALLKIEPEGQAGAVRASSALRATGWWAAFGLWLFLLSYLGYLALAAFAGAGVNGRLALSPLILLCAFLIFASLANLSGLERGHTFLMNLVGIPLASAFIMVFFLPYYLAAAALACPLIVVASRFKSDGRLTLGQTALAIASGFVLLALIYGIATDALRVRM